MSGFFKDISPNKLGHKMINAHSNFAEREVNADTSSSESSKDLHTPPNEKTNSPDTTTSIKKESIGQPESIFSSAPKLAAPFVASSSQLSRGFLLKHSLLHRSTRLFEGNSRSKGDLGESHRYGAEGFRVEGGLAPCHISRQPLIETEKDDSQKCEEDEGFDGRIEHIELEPSDLVTLGHPVEVGGSFGLYNDRDTSITSCYTQLIQTLEQKCKHLEKELQIVTKELDAKVLALTSATYILKKTAERSENLLNITDGMKQNLTDLQNEKSLLNDKLESVKGTNEFNKQKITELQKKVKETISKLTTYRLGFRDYKLKLQKEVMKSENLKSLVDELSGKLSEEKLKSSNSDKQVLEMTRKFNETVSDFSKGVEEILKTVLDGSIRSLVLTNIDATKEHLVKSLKESSTVFQTQLQNSFDSLNNNQKETRSSIVDYHSLIKLNEASIEKFIIEFQPWKNEVREILEAVTDLKITVLTRNFATIHEKSANFEKLLQKSSTNSKEVIDLLKNLQSEYLTKSDCVNKKFDELSQQKDLLQIQLNDSINNIDPLNRKIISLEAENAYLKEQLEKSQNSINKVRSDFNDLNDLHKVEVKNLYDDKVKYTSEMESKLISNKHLIQATNEERAKLKKENLALQTKLNKSNFSSEALEKFKKEKNVLQTVNEQLSQQFKDLSREMESLQKSKTILEKAVSSLKSEMSGKIDIIHNLEDTAKADSKELLKYKNGLSEAKNLLSQEKNQGNMNRDLIRLIEEKLELYSKELAVQKCLNQNEKDAFETKIQDLRNTIKDKEVCIKNLETKLNLTKVNSEKHNENYIQEVALNKAKANEVYELKSLMKQIKIDLKHLEEQLEEEKNKNKSLELRLKAKDPNPKKSQTHVAKTKPSKPRTKDENKFSSNEKTISQLSKSVKSKKEKRNLSPEEDDFSFENLDLPPKPAKKFKYGRRK